MVSQNQLNFGNIDDELVAKVSQELECFKQTFFGFIDKAQKKLDRLESQRKLVHKDDDYQTKLLGIEYELISDLIKIYKELVNSYVVELALFEWPKLSLAKNNQETLSKLYMVTFAKLQEIQVRLAHILPPILCRLDDEDCTLDFDYPKDEEKDIDFLHSIFFGSTFSKPIPPFEHKLATFEIEYAKRLKHIK
jgi:hypothetical protein